MNDAPERPTAGGLVSDALTHVMQILRGEVALARAEVKASLRVAAVGIALLLAAIVMAITALNLFSAALVDVAIYAGLTPAWASVTVGLVFGCLALTLGWFGANALKPAGLVPTRALRGLRHDAETLKEGLTE
jgi:hypothetical protein